MSASANPSLSTKLLATTSDTEATKVLKNFWKLCTIEAQNGGEFADKIQHLRVMAVLEAQ